MMGQVAMAKKSREETVDITVRGVPVALWRFFDVCARNERRSRNGQLLVLMEEFVAARCEGWPKRLKG